MSVTRPLTHSLWTAAPAGQTAKPVKPNVGWFSPLHVLDWTHWCCDSSHVFLYIMCPLQGWLCHVMKVRILTYFNTRYAKLSRTEQYVQRSRSWFYVPVFLSIKVYVFWSEKQTKKRRKKKQTSTVVFFYVLVKSHMHDHGHDATPWYLLLV